MVRVIVEIDNSMCEADIEGLHISITNTVGLRSSDGSTADSFAVFSKTLPGIRAGEKLVGPAAITEAFQLLNDRRQIKPSCNGKLLSSVYDLNLGLSHDVACQCCAGSPGVSLRVMIFPSPMEYQTPSTFTSSAWQPKLMPTVNLAINNAFENFKIGQMMGSAIGGGMAGNYPPPPPPVPPMPMGGSGGMGGGFGGGNMGGGGMGGGGFNNNNSGFSNNPHHNKGGHQNRNNNFSNSNANNTMAEMISQGFNPNQGGFSGNQGGQGFNAGFNVGSNNQGLKVSAGFSAHE